MHLPALASARGSFALVALDSWPTVVDQLGLGSDAAGDKALGQLWHNLVAVVQKASTGMIVDPEFSLPLLHQLKVKKPIAIRLEALSAAVDPLVPPRLIPDWGVEGVAHNYGVAKIALYYNSFESAALAKKQLLAELFDYCQQQHIELLLELQVLESDLPQDNELPFQELQLQAIQDVRNLCHGLVLQFPLDSLTAATITSELDIPWLLNLQGMEYKAAKDTLRQCLESGAAGFVASHTLWQEWATLRNTQGALDWEAITTFIGTEVRDRMIELSRITQEFTTSTG